MVVRTLGGGRGIGSDGEAEGSRSEESQCSTEGGGEERDADANNVCRGKGIKLFYVL